MIEKATQYTIVRYLVGGSTSAIVNLAIFYILNSVIGVHYIVSSVVAFVVAFFVSLAFHKFWTFRDHSTENIHIQGFMYFLSSIFGLGLNTLILYLCVDYFGLLPLLGQIIAGGLTACCTFFISKHLIFNRKENTTAI
jgi:putative flippase GtrA